MHQDASGSTQAAEAVSDVNRGVARCKGCGVAFYPKKTWQTYCSPTCRTKHHKAKSIESRLKALEERVAALEAR